MSLVTCHSHPKKLVKLLAIVRLFRMVPYDGPVWSRMVRYGLVWSRMVSYGPVWSGMVLYGPVWSLMVHIMLASYLKKKKIMKEYWKLLNILLINLFAKQINCRK